MPLLIDGYNLLHASGIIGRGRGPGGFERSRLALVDFVVASLDPQEVAQTTIVFDAAGAPPGLPDTLRRGGLTVRFARGYSDADELIEELIQKHSTPRRLTVVSSDHRLHRAARRRKAIVIDSDRWYADTIAQRAVQSGGQLAESGKPNHVPVGGELEYWLSRFTLPTAENGPKRKQAPQEIDHPFPPGYFDELES